MWFDPNFNNFNHYDLGFVKQTLTLVTVVLKIEQ